MWMGLFLFYSCTSRSSLMAVLPISSWWDIEADDNDSSAAWFLYVHLYGDFGAAGLPGTWKIFFTDVIVGVARAENVITLPMVIYVDDTGSIGQHREELDQEGIYTLRSSLNRSES